MGFACDRQERSFTTYPFMHFIHVHRPPPLVGYLTKNNNDTPKRFFLPVPIIPSSIKASPARPCFPYSPLPHSFQSSSLPSAATSSTPLVPQTSPASPAAQQQRNSWARSPSPQPAP